MTDEEMSEAINAARLALQEANQRARKAVLERDACADRLDSLLWKRERARQAISADDRME